MGLFNNNNSIDSDFKIPSLEQLLNERDTKIVHPEMINEKGSARMTRGYNKMRKEYYMIDSFFDRGIPKWIEGVPVPLVEGKGTPTALFIDLRAMILLEIPQGGVEYFIIYNVHEWDTVFDLTSQLKQFPDKKTKDLIQSTRLFQARTNVIIQSGHLIEDVKIETAGSIFSHPHHLSENGLLEDDMNELSRKYDINLQDMVFWNFSIIIKVKPNHRYLESLT
jgi:hypothetical protein